ncbi:ATP-binding protein [Notoacmeibacter sp. MSK16QG-6]|uniref:ATP-binding protein n=1 Tax=Notoacmeibacter sp. MSK16QG-6 TaxID=2957982 RepID=UPI00209E455F|nr:ATP-binding protein [Notoacmeibacter sp. MSK16QG-6]MCP1198378.1 ATP-binding protein [Notoacmeibacter sp. MSK16QG-6]
MTEVPQNIQSDTWQEVLVAVDRTYAELIEYQERLEAQNNELNALRRFMSSVLASITDYLLVTDRSGAITESGQATCKVLGEDVSTLKSRNITEFFRASGDQDIGAALAQVINTRKELIMDAELIGEEMTEPVELRLSPQLDRRRKAIGAVLTARPLGELKRAYSELELSHDRLKQAQMQLVRNEKLASLGRLLAGVAHELNNPIAFVYANTHAMEKYADRFGTYFDAVHSGASREELIELRAKLRLDREMKNLRSAVEGARDGAQRVRDLVDDLRRLSADGTGEFEQFDLVEAARTAARWIERGTKRKLDIGYEGLKSCSVKGRLGHIQQVLLNLVQNAADAVEGLDEARITLEFSYEGDRAVMMISDTGPGVSDEAVTHIFDPFYTTKEVGRGTGLGLSISYKIVSEHSGELVYVRDQKAGATFKLSLPAGNGE